MVGYFNSNGLDFNESKMVQNFVSLMFRHGLIPTVNKPTRVIRNTATAIDHIITNLVMNAELKTGLPKLTYSITFPYSSYLNLLLILMRPGKNLYTNEITLVIQ